MNFIFTTKYEIPKSSKPVSQWLSKESKGFFHPKTPTNQDDTENRTLRVTKVVKVAGGHGLWFKIFYHIGEKDRFNKRNKISELLKSGFFSENIKK